MAADEASLQCLTKILSEFYSGSVDADRRTAIHNVLMSYEQTPTAWYSALYYMYATSEKVVALYSLGVIERTVLNRWPTITEDEKSELLRVLRFYVFERFAQPDSYFLAKKTAQVLSVMSCLDGVGCCDRLIGDVKNYLLVSLEHQDLVKVITGLHALTVVLEQILDPSELVSYSGKLELRHWISNESAVIYDLLLHIVLSLLGNQILTVATTILQNSLSQDPKSTSLSAWNSVFQLAELLITDASEQSVQKCSAFLAWLECLSEALKILPLSSDSLVTFYNALVVFSLLGSPTFMTACTTYTGSPSHSTDHLSPTSLLNHVSLTALGCIQEVVERKDLSLEVMRKHLSFIFPMIQCHLSLSTGEMAVPYSGTSAAQQTRPCKTLAETVAADTQSQSSCSEYRLKLIDILKCLMTNIFCQIFESADSANTVGIDPVRFLGLLHDFSFATSDLDCYLSCLSLWKIFLEFLRVRYFSNADSQRPGANRSGLPSYLHTPLLIFGKTLFTRLLHSEAANFLETLEEDVSEEGWEYMLSYCTDVQESGDMMCVFRPDGPHRKSICEPCEYRVFLRETLTTFSIALDLMPEPLVSYVLERYHAAWNDYTGLIKLSDVLSSDEFAFQPKDQPLHRVHWALRDFATITQAVGFVIERITVVTSHSKGNASISGHGVIQSLVHCLKINRELVPALFSVKQSLIRSDLIHVVVHTLMTLQSIILGNHLSVQCKLTTGATYTPDTIVLSEEEKNVFLAEVIRIVEAFILPTSHGTQSIPLCIKICSARLFDALCTSPLFTVLQAKRDKPALDQSESVAQDGFLRILGSVCDDNQRVQLQFDLLRLLLRTFVQCLSEGPVEQMPFISDSLDRLISCLFLPYITRVQLRESPLTHLLCLGLLNEAVNALESRSSSARHHIQARLAKSGLLDELVVCITSILNPDTTLAHPSISLVSVCTAYLTFFTTYIRVLSQAGSIGATIPELMSRIIGAIYSTTSGSDTLATIPMVLVDRLLNMFILIAKSRRIFVPLVGDIVDLCLYRFLPGLVSDTVLQKKIDEESLANMVFAAGMHNPGSMKLLCELLFATLLDGFTYFFETRAQSGNDSAPTKSDLFVTVSQRYVLSKPDVFNRILFILITVFHERQVDSGLVTLVLEKFSMLHGVRKFYQLPAFSQCWLPELLRCLLTLLVHKHHNSCRDAILMALHELTVCNTFPDINLPHVNTSTTPTNGAAFFVYYFLPAYLNTLPCLTETQRASVLSPFFISRATGLPNTPIHEELVDLTDFGLFTRSLDQLVTNLRAFIAASRTNLGVIPSGAQPGTTMFDM